MYFWILPSTIPRYCTRNSSERARSFTLSFLLLLAMRRLRISWGRNAKMVSSWKKCDFSKNVEIVENYFFSFFFENSTISLSNDSNNLIFWCFIQKILYLQKKFNFCLEIESVFEPINIFLSFIFFKFTKLCLTKLRRNFFLFYFVPPKSRKNEIS